MQQAPKFFTGDMVYSVSSSRGISFFEFAGNTTETGIVISVQPSNGTVRVSDDYFPYVYYVFFPSGVVGPLWQSQLTAL